MRGDGQHRHPAALGVEQPVDQVQVAGPAAARAHRELPGQGGIAGRGEARGLLMTDVFPAEMFGAPDGVGDPLRLSPGNP